MEVRNLLVAMLLVQIFVGVFVANALDEIVDWIRTQRKRDEEIRDKELRRKACIDVMRQKEKPERAKNEHSEAVRRLKAAVARFCQLPRCYGAISGRTNANRKTATQADNSSAKPTLPGKWNSVADVVPASACDVMTFGSYGYHKACFEWGTNDDPCWWSSEVPKADFRTSVTHWREMP